MKVSLKGQVPCWIEDASVRIDLLTTTHLAKIVDNNTFIYLLLTEARNN